MEWELILRIKLLKDWVSLKDFEFEIDAFNRANEGLIEISIKDERKVI